MPYVDKVKSVKNTGVSQPRWAIWREIWKWSCLPSLLYCISRKTVDTEYTYYSWCMTSTDIVKWRKNEWLWNFEKGMIYMKILKKGGRGSREKGGGGNEIHAPCACVRNRHISSQLFCLQVRSVTPWQLHDRKSRCLRGRRHSSIYSPSGFFSSYFINEVNF